MLPQIFLLRRPVHRWCLWSGYLLSERHHELFGITRERFVNFQQTRCTAFAFDGARLRNVDFSARSSAIRSIIIAETPLHLLIYLGNECYSMFPAFVGMRSCRTDCKRKKREIFINNTIAVRYIKLFYIVGLGRHITRLSTVSCRHLYRIHWKNVGFSASCDWSFATLFHHWSCHSSLRVLKWPRVSYRDASEGRDPMLPVSLIVSKEAKIFELGIVHFPWRPFQQTALEYSFCNIGEALAFPTTELKMRKHLLLYHKSPSSPLLGPCKELEK